MPRIFDNIDWQPLPALKETMEVVDRAERELVGKGGTFTWNSQ